jgi:hypothetical protein
VRATGSRIPDARCYALSMGSRFLIAVLLPIGACSPSVDDRRVDPLESSTSVATVSGSGSAGSSDWTRARWRVIEAEIRSDPRRAVEDFVGLADAQSTPLTLVRWIGVANRLTELGHFAAAKRLLAAARKRARASEFAELDAVERSIDTTEFQSRAARGPRPAWIGQAFTPSETIDALCALVPSDPLGVHDEYLRIAKSEEPSPEDYGALALAFYEADNIDLASNVLWSGWRAYPSDRTLLDLWTFVHGNRDREPLDALPDCDGI